MFDETTVTEGWKDLSDLERRAVVLKVNTGQVNKQIAVALGVNEGSIKRATVRAMDKLGVRGLVALVRAVDFATGEPAHG